MRILAIDEWQEVGKARIFCFGGGKVFRQFTVELKKLGWLEDVEAVIDNNEASWGTTLCAEGREIPVKSPEALRREMNGQTIVISCLAKKEILAQLEQYPELAEAKVAYFQDIMDGWMVDKAKRLEFPNGLRSESEPLIPNVIHYCWFGGAPIPREFQAYIDGWRRMCPDFEIRRWDESNYDVTKNAYMKAAYEAKKWGFVPDYARLDIIYEHGGIYLDTDVEVMKNLEELRYNKAFAGVENPGVVNFGLGFGAVAHHPMVKELRDAYDCYTFVDFRNKEEISKNGVVASPVLQTREFEKYGYQKDCWKMQHIRDFHIYPLPVLGGYYNLPSVVTRHTYTLHHYAGTWLPKE